MNENPQMKDEKEQEKKKKSIPNLFRNNYFLLALSVVIAFFLWTTHALNRIDQEYVTTTIADVPLNYTIPESVNQLGLSLIDNESGIKTVNVVISGKSYVVEQVTAADLSATARSSGITSAGNYTSEINVANISGKDFNILSWDPRITTIRLDRTATREFTLTSQTNQHSAVEGYTLMRPTLSDEVVYITGPETDLEKIAQVVAVAEVPKYISSTNTYEAHLKVYDEYGEELNTSALQFSFDTTEITIVVMKLQKIPVEVEIQNMPEGFDPERIKIMPEDILVTGASDIFEDFKSLKVGTIDFSQVTAERNLFEFSVSNLLPSGCTMQEETESVQVEIDLSGMRTREITVTNIELSSELHNTVSSVEEDQYTILTRSVTLTITGPAEEVELLSDEDILLVVDTMSISNPAGQEVEAEVRISGAKNCWVNGSPTVFVQATAN